MPSPLSPSGRARGRALALAPSARSVASSLSFVCSRSLRSRCVLSVRSARSSLPPSLRAPPAPAGAYLTPRGWVRPAWARWRFPPPRGLRLRCAGLLVFSASASRPARRVGRARWSRRVWFRAAPASSSPHARSRALIAHTTPAQRPHSARRVRFAYNNVKKWRLHLEITNVFRIFAPDLRSQRVRCCSAALPSSRFFQYGKDNEHGWSCEGKDWFYRLLRARW